MAYIYITMEFLHPISSVQYRFPIRYDPRMRYSIEDFFILFYANGLLLKNYV